MIIFNDNKYFMLFLYLIKLSQEIVIKSKNSDLILNTNKLYIHIYIKLIIL